MIEQQGRVLELQAQLVKVALGATSGCPACDAGQGCGGGIFGKLVSRKEQTLLLDHNLQDGHLQLEPGQAVIVGISEAFFLKLLARLYLVPLLAALCGAALGHYSGNQMSLNGLSHDLLALMGALFLAALALLINWKSKRLQVGEEQVQLLRGPDSQAGQYCQTGFG
ncbi:MAG: SoxR reducing system RseC family protein [Xanthomonadales bacterium]|nr:SoxR reducing system RseC family protein [Xanthomonadales bacterium]